MSNKEWWETNFSKTDTVSGCIYGVVGAVALWITLPHGLSAQAAQNFLAALANSLGTILGFLITAMAIITAFLQGNMLAVMNSEQLKSLFKAFRHAIFCVAVTLAISLIAIAFAELQFLLAPVVITMILSVIKVARCVSILHFLTNKLVDRTVKQATEAERKRLDYDPDSARLLSVAEPPKTVTPQQPMPQIPPQSPPQNPSS